MSLAEFSRTAIELMSLVDSALESKTAEMRLEIKALLLLKEKEEKAKAIADASSKPGKARTHVAEEEEEEEEQRAEKKRPRKAQKEVVNMKRIRPKQEVNKVAPPIPIPAVPEQRIAEMAEKRCNGGLYAAWVKVDPACKPSSAYGGNVYMALQDPNFRKIVGSGWKYDDPKDRQKVFVDLVGAIRIVQRKEKRKKEAKKKK